MAFDYENYYRLEYLESSGTQYIDTGFLVTSSNYNKLRICLDARPTSTAPGNSWWAHGLGGGGTSVTILYVGIGGGSSNSSAFTYGSGTNDVTTSFKGSIGTRYKWDYDVARRTYLVTTEDGSIVANDTETAQAAAGDSDNATLTIFCWKYTTGTVGYCHSDQVYSYKLYENDVLVRSLIPAQRISDSVLGLYDEVNNTFYTNAGNGTFIAGPIIVASPVSMEKGISIPATVSTDNTTYYTTQSTAFTGLGYPSAAVSTSTVSVPSNNGAQSWTGTKNEFTGTGTCTGFDDEGFVNEGAAVTVTGLNAMIPAGMGIAKAVVADVAYNAVWNDIVDCIEVPDNTELEYGRAYCFDGEKFYFSTKYLDDGYIGIHSDTAGMFMGNKQVNKQLRVASAGFVLAYVDKTYPPGTPLTVAENGTLTKLKEEDIEKNPHKLVGTFWKDEPLLWWGFDLAWSDNLLVEVKGRKWIKVK